MKPKEKKQSSIEWLMNEVSGINENSEIMKQAKQKHKDEISDAWESGYDDGFSEGQWTKSRQWLCGEHYHDETFGRDGN